MKNAETKKIVPSAKSLINIIVCSDDIRTAANKLHREPMLIYNVLNGNNKRDENIVIKVLKKTIAQRLKKEQKILEKINI